MVERWKRYSPQLLSVLRIVAAFMFIQNGTMKLFAFPAGLPGGGTAVPFTEIWFAGVLELVGGTLVLLGILTRPVAFLLAGEMAVAYFQAHAPSSFWTVINGGTPAVLYCFFFLYLSAEGPGPWTVPALWHARPKVHHPTAPATPHLRA
jgi:putative oxidoreductase